MSAPPVPYSEGLSDEQRAELARIGRLYAHAEELLAALEGLMTCSYTEAAAGCEHWMAAVSACRKARGLEP